MIDVSTFAAIGAAFLIVAVSPGPANLACATIAMGRGFGPAMLFGLGLSLGLAIWGVLAATGLGAVLHTSATALTVLKVLGGAYLFWLAFGSGRSAARSGSYVDSETKSGKWFLRGLLLNLSNPKSALAWLAALSVGLDPADPPTVVAVATLMCVGIGVLNYVVYSWLFSRGGVMGGYRRIRRWVDGVAASLFALAGFAMIRSALSR